MSNRSFVHLHCHTHYSLLDGANHIPELVAHVKSQGMNSVAITDHGNMYGAIEFYRECRAADVNPIIGYEAYVAPGKRTEREARRRGEAGFHLTLLAKNNVGFQNLCKMSSRAFLEGYYYIPRIDKELLEEYHEGVICLSGCASSEFSEFILKDQHDEALELAKWFHQLFRDDFYIEIQDNGLDIQKICRDGAVDIARKISVPLVATCDAHYLTSSDAKAHEVLLCINTGKTMTDENRMRYGSNLFYVRGPEEMYDVFPEFADAVQRSQEIADGVDIQLDFTKRHFPVFTPPDKKTAEDYLRELCEAGLRERYGDPPPQHAVDRLEHELGIICRMGFASYFLIVWDFVRFAISRDIPAGARGSAVGSIVSYVLKFSHIDPLEFDLLFERFLDPNRSEAPDIDIDFCQERREEVIQYVREKYGEESVAQIVTFGTLAAKAAIRDVGRALNVPLDTVNRLTGMIPKVLNISLDESLKQSPELRAECENDKDIAHMMEIARRLEGSNRQVGTHAAGVVISDGPLMNYVPLHRVQRKGEGAGKNGDAVISTQWEMTELERVGMLKVDFLGLRTLTVLDNCVKLIKKTRGETIDLLTIPRDDAKTYQLLQRGETKGVFQLESEGIRELLKRMKPDSIRDLIACNALYRPGPLGGGMVEAYVNRKHGREEATYQHPIMESILSESYGVMAFQEQVMRILNQLGGIELSSAYACIKAISKKKHDIINKRKTEFIQGAGERGVDETTAKEIFDLITYFGGYGFNKSHSAAYADIGYQTAFLKAHYTAEFMAALLSSEIDDSNKRDIMVQHIDDARRLGADVLPPDIQAGEIDFTVRDGNIIFGLSAIKGLGRAAAGEIVRAREKDGRFRDFFDFCERIDLKTVSRAAIEKLIKAGAFDSFGVFRAQLWDALPSAMQAANEMQHDRQHGQGSLFEAFDDSPEEAEPEAGGVYSNVPEWSPTEKLKYEKEALDFYVSSHPLAQHENDIKSFSSHSVESLKKAGPHQEVYMGGMLTQIRFQNTKKARNGNTRYIRCRLEDFTGSAECVMWPDDYVRYQEVIQEDHICFVAGAVEFIREDPSLRLVRIIDIETARKERTAGLLLGLRLGVHEPQHIEALARVLKRSPGRIPVFLHVRDEIGRNLKMRAGTEYRVDPDKLVLGELEEILGPGRVKYVRQSNGQNGNGA